MNKEEIMRMKATHLQAPEEADGAERVAAHHSHGRQLQHRDALLRHGQPRHRQVRLLYLRTRTPNINGITVIIITRSQTEE